MPLDPLTVVSTWEEIGDDLRSWAEASHAALIEATWDNAFVARGIDPDEDALAPLVVIANHAPPDDVAEHLRRTVPGSFAVLAVGPFAGAAAIHCTREELYIPVAGITCTPQRLADDELTALAGLVISEPAVGVDPEPSGLPTEVSEDVIQLECAFGRVAPDPDLAAPPEHDILVRLLSDIAVEGGKPLRPKATSVVAYLALHRSVSTERLEEACWFGADGVSHRKRLRDTMTECRDAIGSQHLPPNRGGTYTAGPGLGTDLDLFEWHVDQASRTPPDLGLEHYEAALALVRGKPFSYANAARASFGWVDFEHHATTWDHRIAGVAQAAAGLLIDARRYDDATVLLHRVVRAIPLNSSVVEALIGACLERGDLRGARAVYSEHATALRQAGLGEPGASLETLLV